MNDHWTMTRDDEVVQAWVHPSGVRAWRQAGRVGLIYEGEFIFNASVPESALRFHGRTDPMDLPKVLALLGVQLP